MSHSKRLFQDTELAIENIKFSEPFYYPGELEAEMKAFDLTKYSDEELHAEIARRTFEPARKLLEEAKANLDKSLGITNEQPF